MTVPSNPMPRWLITVMVAAICLVVGFGIGTEYGKRKASTVIIGEAVSRPTPHEADAGELAELRQRLENLENRLALPQNPMAQTAPSTAKPNNSNLGKDSYDGGRRCTAITQKGTRCKRKAQPGKDYCWQHAE